MRLWPPTLQANGNAPSGSLFKAALGRPVRFYGHGGPVAPPTAIHGADRDMGGNGAHRVTFCHRPPPCSSRAPVGRPPRPLPPPYRRRRGCNGRRRYDVPACSHTACSRPVDDYAGRMRPSLPLAARRPAGLHPAMLDACPSRASSGMRPCHRLPPPSAPCALLGLPWAAIAVALCPRGGGRGACGPAGERGGGRHEMPLPPAPAAPRRGRRPVPVHGMGRQRPPPPPHGYSSCTKGRPPGDPLGAEQARRKDRRFLRTSGSALSICPRTAHPMQREPVACASR